MNRRALLSGAAAAVAFSALPLQRPAADAPKSPDRQIAHRRYRKLRRLLRANPQLAATINTLLAPARQRGGYLRLSVTHPRKRVSWISSAHAQPLAIPLEPIQVVAPIPFDPAVGSLLAAQNSNQQFYQILRYQIAMYQAQQADYQRQLAEYNAALDAYNAQQAALVNVMVVPPPDPEPAPEPTFNDPLLNNPYSQYVASSIQSIGLDVTEAMAVAFFIEGAATVLEYALPPIYQTASQMFAEGLAAGSITARLALFGTGLTVTFTGAALVAATFAVVAITLYYVVPEIERQRRASLNDFTGSVSVESNPVVVEPVADAATPESEQLMPYVPDGAPTSQAESEALYPGYNWYWDIQLQTWVYFGE